MSKDEKALRNIFEKEKIDFESGKLSPAISYLGDDPKSGNFTVTLDRITFESIPEILLKVLEAKGFALNIENILACIDQCRFGLSTEGGPEEELIQANEFNFCLEVPAPSKRTKGLLLQKFYEEVKAYEVHIQKLKEKQEDLEKQKKTQSVTSLREEVKELKFENSQLKENIKRLNERLERALNEVGVANDKPDSASIELGAFRIAKVTNLQLKERKVYLKADEKAFTFDLSLMNEVPLVGAKCLAFIDDGVVKKLYPFDEKTAPFQTFLGHVLAVTKDGVKIRDRDRNLLVIPSLNLEMEKKARELIRGVPVLLFKYQGKVIFWKKLKEKKWFRENIIQEDIFENQMVKNQKVS